MTSSENSADALSYDPQTAVAVGRISSAHGLKGEVKVQPLTTFESRFAPGAHLWLNGSPVKVERGRWHESEIYLKLEGIETRTDAEALRGKELFVPQAHELDEEGVYYLHEIIGSEVVDSKGESLGRLADVLSTGANDVYIVRGERGELLLPAIEDVIADVDLSERRIVVNLLPGLEFQKPAFRKPARKTPPTKK